jgi:hypothetical protein
MVCPSSLGIQNVVLIWIIRLVPVMAIGLLFLAALCGSRGRRDDGQDQSDRVSGIRFARGLTLISCVATILVTITTSSDSRHGNLILLLHLNLWSLIIGPLAGLGGLAVYLARARGMERVFGPLAALLAFANIAFLVWAELAAGY